MSQPTYPHDIIKDYVWWLDRNNRIAIAYSKDTPSGDRLLSDGSYNSVSGIRERSYTGEFLSPHVAVQVRLFCIKKAEVLDRAGGETAPSGKFISTNMDDEPEFPTQFHRALVYYVISKLYESNPELFKLSQVFDAKYKEYKDRAHRFVGNKRFYGPKQVKTSRGWSIS